MDIQRAKEEIKTAVRAYLACDDTGAPLIPAIRQRPILLMGPPDYGYQAASRPVLTSPPALLYHLSCRGFYPEIHAAQPRLFENKGLTKLSVSGII